ncbi:MAG: hypothetical protein MAG453_00172 [Calditrichaeota bacterium]|nr:hypothetical protein [Calditrichota bacterium]
MADNEGEPRVPTTPETPDPDVIGDEPTAVVNPWRRVFTVFWDPVASMRGVKLAGRWLMPFLFFVICVVIFALAGGDTITEFARDQMSERFDEMVAEGTLTHEQADQIYEQQANSPIIGTMMYVNPIVGGLLMKLVIAALFILIGNVLLGGSEKFGRYWSLAWYAGVIGALHIVLYGILVGVTNDPHGGYIGLAVFTKANPEATLHKLAQVANVFLIWEAIVAGIGLSVLANKTRSVGILSGLLVYLGLGVLTSLLFGQPAV